MPLEENEKKEENNKYPRAFNEQILSCNAQLSNFKTSIRTCVELHF